MCFDAKLSIATLVVGTLINAFNIFYFKDPTITAASLLWEWVLLMQLFDGIAWLNQPSPNAHGAASGCNKANKFAAKGAMIANVLQPVVLAILFFALQSDKISDTNKVLSAIITLIYLVWAIYVTNKIPEVTCLKNEGNCSNLGYSWWTNFEGSASVYIFTLASLILLMPRPLDFAIMQLAYITFTFIVSSWLYSCGIASVWCLFSAFAPALITLWKLNSI